MRITSHVVDVDQLKINFLMKGKPDQVLVVLSICYCREMACFKMKQTTSVVPGKVIKKCDSKCVVYSDYGDCLEHK